MRALIIGSLLLTLSACGVADSTGAPPRRPAAQADATPAPAPAAAPVVTELAATQAPAATTTQAPAATEPPAPTTTQVPAPTATEAPTAPPAAQAPVATAAPAPTLAPAPPRAADQALTAPAQAPGPAGPVDGQAPLPDGLLERLRADLVARTGADPAAVTLAGSEAVVWPDGGLGCPQPGAAYTQAPVEGFRVILQAAGRDYDYRVGRGGAFWLCA